MSCHQFEPRDDGLETLQGHTPKGVAWFAFYIECTLAYRLWQSFASGLDDLSRKICSMIMELDPRKTSDLIREWEIGLSLPDPCLPIVNGIEQRRERVMFRLDKRRWTTAQDWKDLAALFGLTITVTPGWHVQRPALWDTCFDSVFWDFSKLGRFRVYVDIDGCVDEGFDYTNDYKFSGGDPNCSAFMCLIERVAPATVVIIWNQDPVGNGWLCLENK